jgi:uncharacterized RDD family membrane protein YckC
MAFLAPLIVLLGRGPARALWEAMTALSGAVQAWTLQRMLEDSGTLLSAGSSEAILRYARTLASDSLADPALAAQISTLLAQADHESLQLFLRIGCLAGLWFVGFERSAWAATPGKRLLGLRVADLASRPVGFGRALARFLAGGLSWLTLNLGHALAGFRRDHRALHDLVAGTQVLGTGPTPRWAWLVLGVALLASVLLPLALLARMLTAISAGF